MTLIGWICADIFGMVQNLVKLVYTLIVMPKAAATPSISLRRSHS